MAERFEVPDFMRIDPLLSEEERTVRDTVRNFVAENITPSIAEHYEAGTFPTDLISKFGELGVLGANLPEEYGCAGMSNIAYGLVMQELEAGDSGIRSFCSVQGALVMWPIYAYGSDEQRNKWLPEMAAGRKIGCFGLTESEAGSNPGGMQTRALRENGEYILNGSKMWITNGNLADIALVWAKTEGDDPNSIRGFLVETDREGVSVVEQKNKASLRASVTSELFFEDVKIPASNMLPEAEGLKAPLSCLTQARYGISWGVLGAAASCYHAAKKYTDTRVVFDEPLAAYQIPQAKLARMLTEITKGQLLALQLGRLKDKGEMQHWQVSMAKMNNCEIALDIAREARDMLGANGISLEYPVIRHMCNLESVKTYEGTHDVHTLVLGNHITGIPAFRREPSARNSGA